MDASGKTFRPTSRGGWAVRTRILRGVRLRRVSSFLSCPADHTTVCSQVISNVLKDKCVRFSAPQEVVFARNDGLPLLDIRPNTQFKQG
jgi:hypothetical protein